MDIQMEQQFEQAPGRPFAEAIGRQPEVLAVSLPQVRERVRADAFALPAAASIAFVGIGASHAAAHAAAWSLFRHGRLAHRYTGAELPAAGADVAAAYVGVSQSGRSPEPLRALQRVEGARRISVTNDPDSPLATVAEANLDLGGLPDSGVSTIAYSATTAALSMLAERWTLGAPDPRWDTLGRDLESLLDANDGVLDTWATRFSGCTSVDVVGAGIWQGTAEAIALVLREALRLPATASETRTYLHGQMDSASEASAQILLGGARELVLREQLASRSRATLVIGSSPDTSTASDVISLDSGHLARDTVTGAALLHELALRWGARLGVDPDEPVFPRFDTKVTG